MHLGGRQQFHKVFSSCLCVCVCVCVCVSVAGGGEGERGDVMTASKSVKELHSQLLIVPFYLIHDKYSLCCNRYDLDVLWQWHCTCKKIPHHRLLPTFFEKKKCILWHCLHINRTEQRTWTAVSNKDHYYKIVYMQIKVPVSRSDFSANAFKHRNSFFKEKIIHRNRDPQFRISWHRFVSDGHMTQIKVILFMTGIILDLRTIDMVRKLSQNIYITISTPTHIYYGLKTVTCTLNSGAICVPGTKHSHKKKRKENTPMHCFFFFFL